MVEQGFNHCRFRISDRNLEVVFAFALRHPINPKSVVAKIGWCPDDGSTGRTLNASWSNALDAHFFYVPGAASPSVLESSAITFPGAGQVEISFVEWPHQKTLNANLLFDTYIKITDNSMKETLTTLYRISEPGVIE